MSIEERLNGWINSSNPKYTKDYVMVSENIIKGQRLYLLSIRAELKFADRAEKIEITKYFLPISGSKPHYLPGDLYNLNRLIEGMEQEFFIQEDRFIKSWVI